MSLNRERLKQARLEKGFGFDDLEAISGINRGQLFRYERGDNDPTSATLVTLARSLDISIDYLVGLTDTPHGSFKDILTPDEVAVLDAYRRADVVAMLEVCTDLARKSTR